MMKILVTGKNGQLGSEIRTLESKHLNIDFKFTDSKELDINDVEQLRKIIAEFNPNVIINCAAYTAVDLAEDEPEKAICEHAGFDLIDWETKQTMKYNREQLVLGEMK